MGSNINYQGSDIFQVRGVTVKSIIDDFVKFATKILKARRCNILMLRSQHIKYKRPRKILERKLFHYNPNFEIMCIGQISTECRFDFKDRKFIFYQSRHIIYIPRIK